MHKNMVLPACIAGLAVGLSQAGVVPATIHVQEGDTIAGSAVVGLNNPFTNGLGQVGLLVQLQSGQRVVLIDGTPVFVSSDALPDSLLGGEGTMGIGDAGEFIYSPSVNSSDSVWGETGLIATEDTQAPDAPAGFNSTFHSRPRMIDDGSSYWVSGLNDGAGAPAPLTASSTSATARPARSQASSAAGTSWTAP